MLPAGVAALAGTSASGGETSGVDTSGDNVGDTDVGEDTGVGVSGFDGLTTGEKTVAGGFAGDSPGGALPMDGLIAGALHCVGEDAGEDEEEVGGFGEAVGGKSFMNLGAGAGALFPSALMGSETHKHNTKKETTAERPFILVSSEKR